MSEVRLQKIIADRGFASRRAAERLITEGAVSVNGKVVTELGRKADPKRDTIEVSKTILAQKESEKITVAFWKPVGVVCSTHRTAEEKNIVMDFLPPSLQHLYPVGRLDKDSSGLLLLTNDGDLAFRITHPKFSHQKVYQVLLRHPASENDLERIRAGDVRILRGRVRPAPIRVLGGSRVEMILREGKNRHIRRLFRELKNGVKKLRRVGIGALFLDDLSITEGEWVRLSAKEIGWLFDADC